MSDNEGLQMTTGTLTRGQRIWQRVRETRDTTISLWRARLLTESWKETEGLPTQLRRAKAFESIVAGIPIYIDEEQLLVGDFGAWPSAAEWHPELNVTWERRQFSTGNPPYGLDDKQVIEFKEILDYWSVRNVRDSYVNILGDAVKARLDEVGEEGACVYSVYIQAGSDKGWNSPNYEKAIKIGFLGILSEVENELKQTRVLDEASLEKVHLLEAIAIDLKAGVKYANRYADIAQRMAESASGQRKEELNKIAKMCRWVPANPARTFHEAIQTLWFVHVLGWFDTKSAGISPGRVDQYLYSYYKKDIETDTIIKEDAISILECFRVKMSAMRDFTNVYSNTAGSGEAQFHNCTLGGQTAQGKDATNELSFLWLEAAFRVQSPHPTLSIRWHENISRDFVMRAAELTRLGIGYPAWFGDKSTIPYLLGPNMGATLEEARDYQISGCVVATIPHMTGDTWPIQLNMGRIFELALFNGCDPVTGRQFGLKTGRFEEMETCDALYRAYCIQLKFFMEESAVQLNRMRIHRAKMLPQVFRSAFFDDCIKRGQDPLSGGCRYQGSSSYLLPIGIIDAVDSLAAVKKRIFDEGKITKQQLLEALGANFDGYEDVRKMLLAAPKYGNDDDYADNIAVDLYAYLVKMCFETEACFGAKWVCAPHSLRYHSSQGRHVGALPSGRLSGLSLADGAVSPCQGADIKGPTATINSAGKIDQVPIYGTLFNMKFHPSALTTKEDLNNFLSMIKTYFDDYNGKHIQFNVVSRETLQDAQTHPENYRNLVVRVAGYSALWVELERTIQDEIIARTEKKW